MLVVFILLVLFVTGGATKQTYCKTFPSRGAIPRRIPGFGKTCLPNQEGTSYVCKIWACPREVQTVCRGQPTFPASDGCMICRGYCSDNGLLHRSGMNWKCSDGSNTCSCLRSGGIASSYVAAYPQFMCTDSIQLK